jgi:hypothetical protein
MSHNILRIIAADPKYVPDPRQRQAGQDLLATFVGGSAEVRDAVEDQVVFVDCGENLDRISCPLCSVPLAKKWWFEAMEGAYRSGFRELAVTLPCCGGSCSLNDLIYDWPMGFARYILETEDPGISGLEHRQLRALEEALGCRLRTIWAHY